MQPQHGGAPSAEPPGAVSEAAIVQAAVEAFVERHGSGQASAPDTFVQQFPEQVRARILAQIREFLAFDGLLGAQPWEPQPVPASQGRTFGDFVIQEELGRGGMGVVYLAHQKSLNRRVALKVMASGLTLSKRHVERFRREAAAAAQLRHPAMVPVHSFTEVDGTFALAMDFVAGRNLADVLDDLRLAHGGDGGPIEGSFGIQPGKGYVAECAILCAQLASALAAAHTAGIVHRDLKPRNVMLDERHQVRLLDFGLAKSLGEGSISMSGEITGTAHYMSPEQTLAKRVEVDHRADLWSLGVILYELLTLHRPFDGKNLQQVVYQICFQEPAAVQKHNPKVPRDLVTICGKALEKDPQKRYQTAADFEADLLRFLRWEPIHARPVGPFGRLAKWLRRHRTEAALAGAAAVVAIGGLGYAWYDEVAAGRRADGLLAAAEQAAAGGDFEAASRQATEALVLRDEPTVRQQIELYQQKALVAATKKQVDIAESRRLSLLATQTIQKDRELALLLALGAVRIHPSAESRSALLDALGSGFRTVALAVPQGQVYASRWSPDGRLVVTTGAGGDGTNAVLWDANGSQRSVLRGHQQQVLDAAFHPGGELVATAGVDKTVRLWRTADGAPMATWPMPGMANLVGFDRSGSRLLSACYDLRGPFVVQVHDAATGAVLGACRSHKRMVIAAMISPCGRYVASGGDRGFLRLWDATTGAELAQLPGQPERPSALAFAPDGAMLAVTAPEGRAHLYAVPSGRLLGTIAHSQPIDSLRFDATGERLLSGGRDHTARSWRLVRDAATDALAIREERTFVGHTDEVDHAEFDRSGQFVVTAGRDGVLRIFDASGDRETKGVELLRYEVGAEVEQATFDPDSRRILAQVGTQKALVWDFADARGVVTLRQRGAVPAACFDATGDRLATAGDDAFLRLWNAHDGRLLWTTPKLADPVASLDVDEAGERIVRGSIAGEVAVHRLADGELLWTLAAHQGKVPVVRFAGGGTRLLTAAHDRTAVVWNCNDRSVVLRIERPAAITTADLSPDGLLLATVDKGEAVARLWSVPTGEPRGVLGGPEAPIHLLRFRPDGGALLLASADGTARIVAQGGSELAVLRVGKPVHHAAWSRDGQRVLTSSRADDHHARLWRVADATEELHFRGHDNTVECNAFSPDGQWCATTSNDGTARIWPTDPVAAAARLQLREPKPAELQAYGLPTPTQPK